MKELGVLHRLAHVRQADPPLPEEHELVRSVLDMLAAHVDRREAQEERRRSEQRLRAVVEHTPNVGVQWYDADGRLLSFNAASGRLFGWTAAVLGKTLLELDFWKQREEDRFAELRQLAAQGRAPEPTELCFHSADGSEGVLLSTVFELPDPEREACYVRMDVDLTQRRRAEDALRASDRLLGLVHRSVPDAVRHCEISLLASSDPQPGCTHVVGTVHDVTQRRRAETQRRQLEVQLHQVQRLQALGTLAAGIAHDFNHMIAAIAGNCELALLEGSASPQLAACLRQIQRRARAPRHRSGGS